MANQMHDAEPMDVYVDEHGELWRVIGLWNEPTVKVQQIESDALGPARGMKFGAVNAQMWEGWKRIYRPLTSA